MKIRRWYVPMTLTHMESGDGPSNHAYACMSQDVETVHAIRDKLGRDDIDAVMCLTTAGDYSDIYVSFYQGVASFNRHKQWFKVVEKDVNNAL